MARFENGYVRWFRRTVFGDIGSNIHCLGLWVYLLSLATWKESDLIWRGERRKLPPGSVVIGLRELSTKLGCSKDTIARWLDYLHKSGRITLEHSTRGSLVTVLNWALYQGSDADDETQTRHESDADETRPGHDTPPTLGQRPTLIEEVKKERKKSRTYPTEFEELYQKYPRHEGKGKGYAIYKKQITSPEIRTDLAKAIENYSRKKKGTDEQFLLMFSTFMGQWEDWLESNSGKPSTVTTLKTLADLQGGTGAA